MIEGSYLHFSRFALDAAIPGFEVWFAGRHADEREKRIRRSEGFKRCPTSLPRSQMLILKRRDTKEVDTFWCSNSRIVVVVHETPRFRGLRISYTRLLWE